MLQPGSLVKHLKAPSCLGLMLTLISCGITLLCQSPREQETAKGIARLFLMFLSWPEFFERTLAFGSINTFCAVTLHLLCKIPPVPSAAPR